VELAKNGAAVGINYLSDKKGALDTRKKIENIGGEAITIRADVGKQKDVEKMFDLLFKKFGKIDILVNNAAVAIWKPFEEYVEDDWDKTINTNLKSIFMCSKLSVPSMRENGGGIIINIGSMAGHAYLDCLIPYCASKGGVNLITKSLAVELAKYNIRVNCISPGTTAVGRNYNTDPDFPDNWLSYIPQGRVAKIEDIAEPVVFFCSKKSSNITGQIIYIDGGTTSYIPMPKATFVKNNKTIKK